MNDSKTEESRAKTEIEQDNLLMALFELLDSELLKPETLVKF